MSWIFGKTGYAFFDVWSLVHFAFWFFAGSVCWSMKPNRWLAMGVCLAMALGWEVFERFAEKKWPTVWLSPESWWNSWISDPLMCVLGVVAVWYTLDHWRVS